MAVSVLNFTTGPSTLPDTGTLSYNGCIFSPLFETKLSGNPVKDNARRTVKYMEYTLYVDGYVTMPTGATSISRVMATLRELLTAQGGSLVYQGRGFELVVNPQGFGGNRDVVWGPIPELLEFQNLGDGKSAKIRWVVKVCVVETRVPSTMKTDRLGRIVAGTVLQFNYDTSVTYGEDGYSTLSIRGTLEIPLTRAPSQKTRTLQYTADNYRVMLENQIVVGIDLSRFRVAHRVFNVSRDKRTLEWEFVAEEKPYMDLPPDCTIARGTYSVRPARAGMGLCNWLCTLRVTYTVRADRPRRVAWLAFLALLRLRMSMSVLGNVPGIIDSAGNQNPPNRGSVLRTVSSMAATGPFAGTVLGVDIMRRMFSTQEKNVKDSRKAFLVDLSFDEGLHLDSKTTTFSATWKLATTISHILLASGLWKKLPEKNIVAGAIVGGGIIAAMGGTKNLWATSMRNISGSQSWLPNRLDPKLDVIVDFGGP